MVTAVVLIRSETDQVSELAATLAELEGVSEVFSVAGQYDLVALVRVRENEDLARVISEKMRKLPGIRSSETLIAFKIYSKQDVEAWAAARRASAASAVPSADAANPSTSERISATRATIARRLLESKQQIPHFRLGITVDAAPLVAHRAALRAGGETVSLNDLIVRACALALIQHRALNARFDGEQIVRYQDADICVAVATEAGLITPVVRAANTKRAPEIAALAAALTEKARTGRLTRGEISGGTFTVSNLGMHGVERFDAVINPPQVAILAVGAVRTAVVPREGGPAIGELMDVTLSCDHRVVDGAVGAAFLTSLRELLTHPDRL